MLLKNKNSREKLLYLESLRGVAAIIVAIFHGQIFSTSPFYTFPLITHGFLMVEFFFVLSGFVIAYNYYERIVKFRDLVSFQLKRFLRLYPLHFLTLMIFVVIEILKYLFQVRTGIEANNPAFSVNNYKSFIENIFLVQALFSTKLTWNGPSWSISTEFYTYLIFSFFVLFLGRFKSFGFVVLALVMGGAIAMFSSSGALGNFILLARCIYGFSLGVCCFLIYTSVEKRVGGIIPMIIVVLAILSLCFSNYISSSFFFFPIIFSCVILSLVLSNMNGIKYFLNQKWLVFFGTISYGIYMFHSIVWWVIKNFCIYILKTKTATRHDILVLKTSLSSTLLLYFVGLLITVILAYISYKFIEMPCNRLKNRLNG